jgi:hypothetical protein
MWLSFGFIAPFFVGTLSDSSKCMPIPYLNNLNKNPFSSGVHMAKKKANLSHTK